MRRCWCCSITAISKCCSRSAASCSTLPAIAAVTRAATVPLSFTRFGAGRDILFQSGGEALNKLASIVEQIGTDDLALVDVICKTFLNLSTSGRPFPSSVVGRLLPVLDVVAETLQTALDAAASDGKSNARQSDAATLDVVLKLIGVLEQQQEHDDSSTVDEPPLAATVDAGV